MSIESHGVEIEIEQLQTLDLDALRLRWRTAFGRAVPATLPKHLVLHLLAYRLQAQAFGDVSNAAAQFLDDVARDHSGTSLATSRPIGIPGQGRLMPGTVLIREHDGKRHAVTVGKDGFLWNGTSYPSLSKVAHAITGTRWNGPRFFGLRGKRAENSMKTPRPKRLRCAIYTRVSTDAGLEQDFNSLDAQREASEAYIKSQAHEGWTLVRTAYDDGGFSGGSLDRPALQQLLADVKAGLVDVIVVYKVDRLTRSLADFAKLVEQFDTHSVSFVSVTQSFNTTTSMGRLTLNMLLSFAQFEREVTGERIRDKIAASKKKGIWVGGAVPLGYRVDNRKLVADDAEAPTVRMIFKRYLALGSIADLLEELNAKGITTRRRVWKDGRTVGGVPLTRGPLAYLLKNRTYVGDLNHRGQSYPGEHVAIVDRALFESVQAKLAENLNNHRKKYASSGSLLLGKLFDDRGNKMSPTHSCKRGLRYRYYISRALLDGRKAEAGAISRVPADQVEAAVIEALRARSDAREIGDSDDASRGVIQSAVTRVVLARDHLTIEFANSTDGEGPESVRVPWIPRPAKPKREVLLPATGGGADQRPIRAETRAIVVRAVALGRQWLNELVSGKAPDADSIALRENRSKRSVQMMISLAFVAPDIVEAAVAGRLPRSIGITRLADLPSNWATQRVVLGLAARS